MKLLSDQAQTALRSRVYPWVFFSGKTLSNFVCRLPRMNKMGRGSLPPSYRRLLQGGRITQKIVVAMSNLKWKPKSNPFPKKH